MQIRNKVPSFKARIDVVTKDEFNKRKKGIRIDFGESRFHMPVCDEFWTEEVRSCLAGGTYSDKGAVGFHFFHDYDTNCFLDWATQKINDKVPRPKGGLIAGSKDLGGFSQYSVPNFNFVKEKLNNQSQNISVFEGIVPKFGQLNLAFSRPKETWTMCCEILVPQHDLKLQVNTPDKFWEFFKSIRLAKTDELFLFGKKVNFKELVKSLMA